MTKFIDRSTLALGQPLTETRMLLGSELKYCLRQMEVTKIPLAVPMLESVRVRVFDRYNRLQILREVPLGDIDGPRRQRVGNGIVSEPPGNLLGGELGPKTRART